MDIDFNAGATPVRLSRGWFWGGMKLLAGQRRFWLQHPLAPSTHFSLKLEQAWQQEIDGHQVRIEKRRALMVGGARPQTFRILVDGVLVAERAGY